MTDVSAVLCLFTERTFQALDVSAHSRGGPSPFGLSPKGPKTHSKNEASAARSAPGPPFLQPSAPSVYFGDYRWRIRFTAICRSLAGK